MSLSGATRVAGVIGRPISHSLSPILHNAWLAAAEIDGVYVAFSVTEANFAGFVGSLRGSSVAGLNVTLPFKGQALACADEASQAAHAAEAANVLVFREDGSVFADNTDGVGLIGAFETQAPADFSLTAGPAVLVGAGGAAQGAAAALIRAGVPRVTVLNRTVEKAQAIAQALGDRVEGLPLTAAEEAFAQANAVINATSAGLTGAGLDLPLAATPATCVVMDMTYKPLMTPFLEQAQGLGRPVVDGLSMLIGQAVPSFEAFFGQAPPAGVDVRALARAHLGI